MPKIDPVLDWYSRNQAPARAQRQKPAPTPTPEPGLGRHLEAAAAATRQGRIYLGQAPRLPDHFGTFQRRDVDADRFTNSGIEKYHSGDLAGARQDLQEAKKMGGAKYSDAEIDQMLAKIDLEEKSIKEKGL